jgi:peptidoglycan/xylan/chitin deacetylase (PgdA/CDA1 family)
MSLRQQIKELLYCLLDFCFGWFPTKGASVLMYHSIGDNKVFFTVKPKEFEKQMDYLYRKKYNVVSLKKLIKYLEQDSIPNKTIVITFDDGCQDIFLNAFDVLEKYNFPATIFLTTVFIGKEVSNSEGIPIKELNWIQIKEMHNSGLIDIEPHTVNHPKLIKISFQKARQEILDSKSIIEEKLNKKCDFFSYPYGRYNLQIEKFLKGNNFLGAFTVGQGLVFKKDNLFQIKRNSIDSFVNFCQFKGKLNYSVVLFNYFKSFLKI